jgi:hypothetical protein
MCWAANEHLAWRVANCSSGLVHLVGAARLALETRRHVAGMQRAYVVSSTGLGTAAASFMAADGYLMSEEAIIFMQATLWALVSP